MAIPPKTRREKATSNICSNQGVCTVSALIYMSLLGGDGLQRMAKVNYNNAEYLKDQLKSIGAEIPFSDSFNEFVVKFPKGFDEDRVEASGFVSGLLLDSYYPELKGYYLVTVTEMFSKNDLDKFVSLVGGEK